MTSHAISVNVVMSSVCVLPRLPMRCKQARSFSVPTQRYSYCVMRSQDINTVLAYWVLLNPEFLDTAEATMRKLSSGAFWRTAWLFGSGGRRGSVTLCQARFLLKELGAHAVRIIERKAGYMVTVPPGWAHCVCPHGRALPQEILGDYQPRQHGALPQLLVQIRPPLHQGGGRVWRLRAAAAAPPLCARGSLRPIRCPC